MALVVCVLCLAAVGLAVAVVTIGTVGLVSHQVDFLGRGEPSRVVPEILLSL